jgi:hypothetical protein
MFQTLIGLAVLLVVLAAVVFNERLARSHRVFTLRAFGFDPYFAPDGGRAGFILAGLGFMIMGLLIALHVVPAA